MIDFKNLKKTTLDYLDKIPSGKLKDCRVCDVVEDHYEYLIWCNRNNILQFSKPVVAKLHQIAAFEASEEFFDNEVAPYLNQDITELEIFPDVPF